MGVASLITGLALLGFTGLLLWAAVADMRRYTIPNRISIGILTIYGLYAAVAAIFSGLYPNINGFGGLITGAAVLIAGAALFARGLFGGGDVELLASTAV
jgi:prepilin peptidase CpaA